MGSGNIVHNLGQTRWDLLGQKNQPAPDWNKNFDNDIISWVKGRDFN